MNSKGPQPGRSPRIQHIFILLDAFGITLAAAVRSFYLNHHLTALLAGVYWNTVTPPQLATDTPVFNIGHPVFIGLGPMGRVEFDLVITHSLQGWFDQLGHIHEPLFRLVWFNGDITTFRIAHLVNIIFDLFHEIQLFELLNNIFTGFKSIEPNEFAGDIFIQTGIFIKNIDKFQIMAFAHVPVILIMGWGDLDTTGSKILVYVFICKDRDLTTHQGQNDMFTNQVLIAFIIGMHGNTSIAKHGFWSRCSHNEIFF